MNLFRRILLFKLKFKQPNIDQIFRICFNCCSCFFSEIEIYIGQGNVNANNVAEFYISTVSLHRSPVFI